MEAVRRMDVIPENSALYLATVSSKPNRRHYSKKVDESWDKEVSLLFQYRLVTKQSRDGGMNWGRKNITTLGCKKTFAHRFK